jgi:hypothetical protein
LKGDYKENHHYISANFRGLVHCLAGSMEATRKAGLGMNKYNELVEVI